MPVGSPGTPTAVSVSFVAHRSTPELEAALVAGLTRLAARLLSGVTEPGQLQGVLRGLPDNVTTGMDLRLWGLAQQIRSETGIGASEASAH